MMVTFFVARAVLGDSVKREKTVKTIAPIEDKLVQPSKLIFNSNAINPTVEVYVKDSIASSDGSADGLNGNSNEAQAEDQSADAEAGQAATQPARGRN